MAELTLIPTRVVIGLAYGLQLTELLFLPVPSSFSTFSLLTRYRNGGGPCTGPRLILLAICAWGAMLGSLVPLLFAWAPGLSPWLGLLFSPAPAPCLLGSLLVAMGSALTLVAVLTLRRQGRFDQSGEGEILITTGVFNLIRHPIGAGLGLIYLGFWLLVPSVGVLLGFILFTINARFRMVFEEEEMLRRFGLGYRAYAERVGAFWPRSRWSATTE